MNWKVSYVIFLINLNLITVGSSFIEITFASFSLYGGEGLVIGQAVTGLTAAE